MADRFPDRFAVSTFAETNLGAIDQEILAEKASSLGNAGRKVEQTLAALRQHAGGDAERAVLLRRAADAVYAYFVQRELCGWRRHDDIVRDYSIPREVLARLGAR